MTTTAAWSGEHKVADVAIYAPQFDKLAEKVEEIMPEVRKAARR